MKFIIKHLFLNAILIVSIYFIFHFRYLLKIQFYKDFFNLEKMIIVLVFSITKTLYDFYKKNKLI